MKSKTPPFFILTGPPGSGKTTLIEALATHIKTVPEVARRVLAMERTSGGTATGEQDPQAFVARMLDMAVADYTSARGPTVFDRGVPDLLAYCAHYKVSDLIVRAAIDAHRCRPTVFALPAWQEIYKSDAERTLGFDGATAFGDLTRAAYRRSGYVLVDVPKASIDARLDFMLSALQR